LSDSHFIDGRVFPGLFCFCIPSSFMIPALLATFLFCLSAVSATRATRILGGISANFWRLLLATLLLLGAWSHCFAQGLQGAGFAMFFWSGVVGFGIGDLALYQALPRLGSRLTLLLVHCVAAPSAAFAEWLWLETVLTLTANRCDCLYFARCGRGFVAFEKLNQRACHFDIVGIIYGLVAADWAGGGGCDESFGIQYQ
jgi:hypothetical protein